MGKLFTISKINKKDFDHIPSDPVIDYYAEKYLIDQEINNLTFEEYYTLVIYDRGVNGIYRST